VCVQLIPGVLFQFFLLAGRVPSERYRRAAHPQVRLSQEAQDSEEQPSVQEEVLRSSRYLDTDFIKLFPFFYPGCPPFSLPSFSSLATEKSLFSRLIDRKEIDLNNLRYSNVS
jgi:hypothetical protein